jgi:poly-gamma-glutamate synthesis protein (capsule biosynthesis protein)
VDNGVISRVSYLPCLINEQGQPEILGNDERGEKIFDYVDKITQMAELNTRYEWEGDEVVIQPG